ncbi:MULTISPECIES: ABC transporter permease [Pseudomonas syringae group]|uniref:Transport permease protein n=6 Tax=Pseudomonas syringae group TaxID=136849 RepID=A0AA40P1I3_9PSED|nr:MULTISPECIES: ABC transporter permease [Pseudomonas syringae group]KGS15394.1 ABC transporter permease [Pseudomonas coronafaciens]KOP54960.1 ABC transporter permease [Pseudomonas coronafaciens pv. porri]KOP59935.1 ABC transporter permease [Pseudomonas coronafaciens pv. porri]KPW34519.1 O-antigen ABC transporter, permease protein [Pseudomonas coronafaciens pv. atropurpurea]KPX34791.1 O-antigen ABC transporter, permease protein [Pseudomonas coronafaciens pv. garcae]
MNPHQTPSAGPLRLVSSLWTNRSLISQMTKREVIGRYRGSVMGLAWSFFNPVLMLAVYTFVFSEIFSARWVGVDTGKGGFAILLFVGMIVHGLFAECANRAPSLVMSNSNYVKKVVFPLEILPVITLGSALFHSCISLIVLVIAQLLISHTLYWTALLFPLILVPLILGTLGISWFLASLGVYLRDVGHVITVLTTVLLFLSPVLYPVAALPEVYRPWLQMNPLTYIIEESRSVLLFGNLPHWDSLGIAIAVGAVIAVIGFWFFQKTRKGFADVI